MKKLLGSLLLAVSLASSAATGACVVRGHAMYTVDFAPPPPRAVDVVVPRPGFVWIDGFWQYRDGGWRWRAGYWVRERPGQIWIPGAWEPSGPRWHWREGRWERHGAPPPERPRVIDHRSPTPPPPVVPPPHLPPHLPPPRP
ncbi:MAG TPA: YXWGXW repeat-containing protein [Kofleriaceae bacterium]|nr:YXWGXW repeat-containing protein [Kofleriaceae bacterium]